MMCSKYTGKEVNGMDNPVLEALAEQAEELPIAYMNVCVACTEDYTA